MNITYLLVLMQRIGKMHEQKLISHWKKIKRK